MKKTALFFLLVLACFAHSAPNSSPSWEKWGSLLGNWEGEGKGAPGSGTGKFSFALELQNKVIVRKSHVAYPAAEVRPVVVHDDLMIIYLEEDKTRADYFDNEGHVIRYTAEISSDNRTITFVSDAQPSQPFFRLTYVVGEGGRLAIKFEIAPPTAPKDFKVYVEGSARKI